MEGDPEDSDDDVGGQDRSCLPHSAVLWEKSIQQSIFVDLSEDESLHFSDLESSFVVHLSQAESACEASIHLSGSTELSALDVSSSECSSVSSQDEERIVEGKTKSSMMHVPSPRPDTVQDELPSTQGYEDPGQNTSDEDQEDLPYDGDLGSPYFNNTASTEKNSSSDERETLHVSPGVSGTPELTGDGDNNIDQGWSSKESNAVEPASKSQKGANDKHDSPSNAPKPTEGPPLCSSPVNVQQPDITQLLLQHFSQEELLRLGRLIEAETLPEVSLLESMDETLLSRALTHNATAIPANGSSSKGSPSGDREINQSFFQGRDGRTGDRSNTASETSACLEQEDEKRISNATSSASDSNISNSKSMDSNKDGGDDDDPDLIKREKEDVRAEKASLVRTRSFSDMKYGQGQVHYPLPDFSKVAPKVKIPKTPNGPARSIAQSPGTMHRAQSSPGMLEVISRVLEDSVQPSEKPYVFKDQDKQTATAAPALVHHLQAEYDKLLTKYAEAENLIDQMRLGNQPQAPTDLLLEFDCGDCQDNQGEGIHFESLAPPPPPAGKFGEEPTPPSSSDQLSTASSCQPDQQGASDGERLTTELRDIISQFMQKVEEFKLCLNNMTSVSIAEQQMILRSMMEAQDQLERKYIGKKEEHRALEMQNYMGLSRNTGTFDPNRLVEGDIFRIGMHLEDIKEMIDRNMCDQLSPPQSSSTPALTPPSLSVKPSPRCPPTPLPLPSQNEGPSSCFSTESYEVGRCKRDTYGCVLCIDTQDSALSPESECDLGASTSLTAEVSCSSDALKTQSLAGTSLSSSCVSQRIVSPETDSGFGSSDLSRPATGTYLPKPITESAQPQIDGLSGSDSEGSCSNLQTAIHPATSSDQRRGSLQTAVHPATPTGQQTAGPRTLIRTQSYSAGAAVDLRAESTGQEPRVWAHESDPRLPPHLHHHLSEPILIASMEAPQRSTHLHSCSCNSEVILALQSEVSRLKKDLEEGLVQLPHLAQKMDYLTSKYRLDRQDRRAKPRSRTHHKTSNSVWKPSGGRSEVQTGSSLSTSHTRIEDWISTDMDPSKSKGTDSGDTDVSSTVLQYHSSPVGGSLHSCSRVQGKPQGKQQSYRGSEENCSVKTSGLTLSSLKTGNQVLSHSDARRTLTGDLESAYSQGKLSPFSSPSLQKPLLQVNYGSSCSLPASYKVRETALQSASSHRKRSTQSDTALLPSNVYFQRTLSPALVPSKTGSRASRRRGSKEEEMSKTLDRAIEAAYNMKRTTDRMAKSLSGDLAKAQLYRKLNNMQPLGGRKHNAL
ncbi:uncharacterized protein aknad1 [Polymixia lowei]